METSSKPSKPKKISKGLLILLGCIGSHGDNLGQIRQNLGISKQLLYKRLKVLIRDGLIKQLESYPTASYELTDFGRRVNQNSIYDGTSKNSHTHENISDSKPLWKIHAFTVRFPIFSFGTINFEGNTNRKIAYLPNFNHFTEVIQDFKVRIQSNGLLLVYCPSRITANPEQEFTKLGSEAQNIAQDYCNKFNMKLGLMQISRSGHKTLIKSERLAHLLGKFRTDEVWTDDSEGTGDELEESQDSKIIESLLELPKKIDILTNVTTDLSVNIRLHLDVLTKMSGALDKFNENMDKMNKNLERSKI